MESFSFIHASDLHLDSPFVGISNESEDVARALRSATFEAYDRLIELCIDKKVQFLVIAGDVYDGADRSLRAQLKFSDGLKKLAEQGIRSFVAHGNHDPLSGWSSNINWPEEVHIFRADQVETKFVELNGRPMAAVSGISYGHRDERSNLSARFEAQSPDLFQIAVLHANCGSNTSHESYAPCRLDDLTGTGFDYWALGHFHSQEILHTNPHVVYPGNTQGLSIREQEPKGCYLVTVDQNSEMELEFYPTDSLRWFSRELDISAVDTIDRLDDAIGQAVSVLQNEAQGRPVVCRISLIGRSPLYRELNREDVETELLERAREMGMASDPFVWVQAVEVDCLPEVDLNKRREINDLLGNALTVSHEASERLRQADSDELEPADLLGRSLDELYSNHRARRWLDDLSKDDVRQLIKQAELLCFDLLES